MSEVPDPHTLMVFLDTAAGELDQLGRDLEEAHLELGEAEADYLEYREAALLLLVEEYEAKEKRLPGEDIRLAKAHKRMDLKKVSRYRKAKARVEGLKVRARKLETAVNARQSTLKGLREESMLGQAGFTGQQDADRKAGRQPSW